MSYPRPTPARQPALREHNLALVLREVADHGPLSRARIAAATGLTKATVSTLVEALVLAGLLRERGPDAASGVGRPGSSLALAAGPVGIGLEINVDYVASCTVDLGGDVRRRQVVADDFRRLGPSVTLARAASVVRTALQDAEDAGDAVAGVGIAVPGLVEPARGLVRLAPNLEWRDLPLVQELATRCQIAPELMRLDNEANLAAQGELWCGGHRGVTGSALDSFVHISGEIGVGGAIVLGGRLLPGTRGFGGEIGHLPLAADGPRCGCGSQGCLEQYAGQEAILRRAGVDAVPRSATARPGGPIAELVARARQQDGPAREAIAAAGDALGIGISVVVNLVDVDTVILGGIYAELAEWILEPVRRQVRQRVLADRWAPVHVVLGTLGAEGAVRGAAVAASRAVIDDPAAWIAAQARARACAE